MTSTEKVTAAIAASNLPQAVASLFLLLLSRHDTNCMLWDDPPRARVTNQNCTCGLVRDIHEAAKRLPAQITEGVKEQQ